MGPKLRNDAPLHLHSGQCLGVLQDFSCIQASPSPSSSSLLSSSLSSSPSSSFASSLYLFSSFMEKHFGIFAYFAYLGYRDTGYFHIWPCCDHRRVSFTTSTFWYLCLFCSFVKSWHRLSLYLALLGPSVACHCPHQHICCWYVYCCIFVVVFVFVFIFIYVCICMDLLWPSVACHCPHLCSDWQKHHFLHNHTCLDLCYNVAISHC